MVREDQKMTNTVIALSAFVIYGILLALFALAWKRWEKVRNAKRVVTREKPGTLVTHASK